MSNQDGKERNAIIEKYNLQYRHDLKWKVFTGRYAHTKALKYHNEDKYHNEEGRIFTHVMIEIHDKHSKFRIYAVIHEDTMMSLFESKLEYTIIE